VVATSFGQKTQLEKEHQEKEETTSAFEGV
jgi:hypothetical protein